MSVAAVRIGPADHGRRMTLDDFEHAETEEGFACELHRGTVTRIDVPHLQHAVVAGELRRLIEVWRTGASRFDIFVPAIGSCKIVVPATQSERHPDLALYLAPPPPDVADADLWRTWVPEIVVEVVSAASRRRDYDEKPEDYLAAGVREYWIVDPDVDLLTVLTRSPRGTWTRREVRPPETYATPLLPEFVLDLASFFAAARRWAMSFFPRKLVRLGPADHGRRMTLDDFEHAETEEGLACELHRGTVTRIDVPHRPHARVVDALRLQIDVYRTAHPEHIDTVAEGSGCKIVVPATQSERHPDLALYLAPPPPDVADADLWRVWVPEIVVEVVSATSRRRDYDEKPDDYREAGVREYWIVDPDTDLLTVLTRSPRGTWSRREIRPPETYATPLLPDFALDLAALFAAARR